MAIGYLAMRDQTTGNSNTAIGWQSMIVANHANCDQNTAVGYISGNALSEGQKNTLIGNEAGANRLTTGDKNTGIGAETLGKGGAANLTGDDNTCLGFQAGLALQGAAHSNTFIGSRAGDTTTVGTQSTIVGMDCIASHVDGTENLVFGRDGCQGEANGNYMTVGTNTGDD